MNIKKIKTNLTRLYNRIDSSIYFWKCKIFTPYNKLNISSLEPTWNDRDKVLLHAAFQVFTDFIEKEDPFGFINWEATPEHSQAAATMRFLYKWWTEERPDRIEYTDLVECPEFSFEADSSGKFFKMIEEPRPIKDAWEEACRKQTDLDVLWEKEDQDMLHKLVEIRRFLWT
jgi:hypothetical protein